MFEGKYLIFSLVNLVILIIALVYFFRKPIKKFFFSRSEGLGSRKNEVTKALGNAELDYKKYYEQIKNINQHMQKMMKDAELEGEQEGLMVLYNVEKAADHLISQSMMRADQEIKKKNVEFYKDIAEKSVSEAESILKQELTIEKQVSLGRAFLKNLSEKKRGSLRK